MTVNRSAYLWLLDEKKKLAEEGYHEIASSYTQLKTRLMSLLTFSLALCTACYGGLVAQSPYSLLCLLMALGFTLTALLCVAGLYPTKFSTKNIEAKLVDDVMTMEPSVVTKEEALIRFTDFIFSQTQGNAIALGKNRRFLKSAWITLGTTPILAFLSFVILQMVGVAIRV